MKTIEDLRAVLFDTLAGLKDGSVDLERAKAVSDLSQTIINTGKLEVEYMRQTGKVATGFIPQLEAPEPINGKHVTPTGVAVRTADGVSHRMR